MANNIKLSSEQSRVLQEEQDLLLQVKQGLLILEAENKKKDIGSSHYESIIELRDSLVDTLPEDVPAVMAQMERMVLLHTQQDSHNFVSSFNMENPYFAHIRLSEKKRNRDLLIGNQNCFSTHLPCPIVDWKNAPISKIFYRYREGDEYVEEIGEKELEGKLITRRMLLIDNGILVRINWPGGILENLSHHELRKTKWRIVRQNFPKLESGQDKTLDEINTYEKLKYKSEKTKNNTLVGYKVDKHLHHITALVDPQQFEIITHSESGIVLIQGGAGSGKTTVALHRLAYLMSKKPHYFKPKNVLPIVFGPAIANYMSKVLPALDVNGVSPKTYHKWVSALRQRALPELPTNYSENTPMDVIYIKRHPLWLEFYKQEINKRTKYFLDLFKHKLANYEETGLVIKAWEALKKMPLIPRLQYLVSWSKDRFFIDSVGKLSSPRMEKKLQNLLEQSIPELFQSPHLLISQIWNDCLVNKELLTQTINKLAPGEFNEIQLTSVWTWAVRQYQIRQESTELFDSDDHSLIKQIESSNDEDKKILNEKKFLDEEDDSLLLLLYQFLMGPLKKKNGKILQYTHLMLDEAQDFGALEFQLLVSLTTENLPSVTLAGDLDQRIMEGRKNETWEEALSHLRLPNGKTPDITALAPLKIGYRSTSEIMSIAKKIIGEHSVNNEWHAKRKGAPVELFRFKERGPMVAFLADTLEDLTIREPLASVAVLLRTQETALALFEGLQRTDLPNIRFISDQEFSFTPGIDVTNISQTKGLEFDTVIIADVDASTYGPDIRSRQLLYVGATRAAHQLWLLHCGNPSPLIAGIEEKTF